MNESCRVQIVSGVECALKQMNGKYSMLTKCISFDSISLLLDDLSMCQAVKNALSGIFAFG